MTNRRPWVSDKDRGNGWFLSDYQDSDRAICKTMTIEELKALDKTPPSESIITIVDEDLPGYEFELHIQPKEYKLQSTGQRARLRKPVNFCATIQGDYFGAIPLPGQITEKGGWFSKFYYSHAVKLLANDILPAYKLFFGKASRQDSGVAEKSLPVSVR